MIEILGVAILISITAILIQSAFWAAEQVSNQPI